MPLGIAAPNGHTIDTVNPRPRAIQTVNAPGKGPHLRRPYRHGINYGTSPERPVSGPFPLAALEPTVPVEIAWYPARVQVAEFGNGAKAGLQRLLQRMKWG